jgi:uncharacterized OsmC-like protein
MTTEIIYRGELRTEMIHLQSGTLVETDGPKDNHGKGEKFSPTDLVASALGACMLSIMGIAARTHDISVDGFKASVEKIMVMDPLRRIGEIKVFMEAPAAHQYDDKQKVILEKAAMTCPVFISLSEKVIKTVTWNW